MSAIDDVIAAIKAVQQQISAAKAGGDTAITERSGEGRSVVR